MESLELVHSANKTSWVHECTLKRASSKMEIRSWSRPWIRICGLCSTFLPLPQLSYHPLRRPHSRGWACGPKLMHVVQHTRILYFQTNITVFSHQMPLWPQTFFLSWSFQGAGEEEVQERLSCREEKVTELLTSWVNFSGPNFSLINLNLIQEPTFNFVKTLCLSGTSVMY